MFIMFMFIMFIILDKIFCLLFDEVPFLGPFFDIEICVLFLKNYDIDYQAHKNTPYATSRNSSYTGVVYSLEQGSFLAFKWFRNNEIKGNTGKCYVLIWFFGSPSLVPNVGYRLSAFGLLISLLPQKFFCLFFSLSHLCCS